jgi:site-specific recombinase XerD
MSVNRFATADEQDRFERFLGWLQARGRSAATARSYRSDWQDLALWFRRFRRAEFDAAALDADVVEAWRDHGRDRGKSAATLTRRLSFARNYGAWLASEGALEAEVAEELREIDAVDRSERAVRVLADADVHRLLEQVDRRGCRRDQAVLYVLLDTGLKVSELVDLDVSDVEFSTGRLFVRGSRPRPVPLPTRAARKLAWSLAERGLLEVPDTGEIVLPATGGWPPSARVPAPDPRLLPSLSAVPQSPMPLEFGGEPSSWPLFVGERGRLTANAVQRVVRKHCLFARVDASPQVLRHTFAFAWWARTQDLVTLAEILGHESVETTRVYTRLRPDEGEALPPLRASAY